MLRNAATFFLVIAVGVGCAFGVAAALEACSRPAYGAVGAECSSSRQCDSGESMGARQWCLADGPASTSGHCVRLRILP
jgi:hypothetical protein